LGIELKNVFANYRERIQRLALFDPLFRLENKKATDNSGKPIDCFGLGLLTLLFFFENMLLRHQRAGVRDLAVFFQQASQGEIDLDSAGFEKLAREVVEVFRPPSGKRNARTFYNWESRQEETVYYSILKADRFDTNTNTQFYTLDEQGLELVFATREYYSEFQISINQLLLRKQLERGEFWGALRQLDEMRVAVENLQDRLLKMRHEIQRNIVSETVYLRYWETIEDIHLRLNREDREFEEMLAFVRETRERLAYERATPKDQQAYELIIRIDGELGRVHHQHARLLADSIELKTTALQAARDSLYYAGIDSFNFQKEITERLFSTPLPLAAARHLVEPFLFLEIKEEWSPLTVFAPQAVEGPREVFGVEGFLEALDEKELLRERRVISRNYRRLMELVLQAMGEETSISLQDFVAYCKQAGEERLLGYRLFYDFWIILHQRSPLIPGEKMDDREESLLGEMMDLLRRRRVGLVAVVEREEVLRPTERFSIRDMELRLEVMDDAL